MLMVGSNEIGGGFVRLGFTEGSRYRRVGEPLTSAEIKSFHNYRRMIAIGKIAVYPPSAAHLHERHVVSAGFGRFDVFEGKKLSDKALSKEEAEELALRS
jgi:hypothetical protein